MGYHFVFNRSLEFVSLSLKQVSFLYVPVESLHVFFKIGFNSFPENQQSQINIIKKLFNFQNKVFSCAGKNCHFLQLLWLIILNIYPLSYISPSGGNDP